MRSSGSMQSAQEYARMMQQQAQAGPYGRDHYGVEGGYRYSLEDQRRQQQQQQHLAMQQQQQHPHMDQAQLQQRIHEAQQQQHHQDQHQRHLQAQYVPIAQDHTMGGAEGGGYLYADDQYMMGQGGMR